MHPGLVIGWMAPIIIVDSAPQDENLISKQHLGCAGASMGTRLLCIINSVTIDSLRVSLKGRLLPVRRLLWCDLTGMHKLSGLSEIGLSDFHMKCKTGGVNCKNASFGAQLKFFFFFFGCSGIHAALGYYQSKIQPVYFSAVFSPANIHFILKKKK